MHFLSKKERVTARYLSGPRAGVVVRVNGLQLALTETAGAVGIGVALIRLPARFVVVGSSGEICKPSQGSWFYVTAETCDPHHMIVELSSS